MSQQANSPRTGTLQLSTASNDARSEFWSGLEAWQNFGYTEAQHHFERALALDSSLALARVFAVEAAVQRGFLLRSEEMDRGVVDAARASTGEAVMALAWREKAAGRDRSAATLLHAAMELLPNEPHVASEYVWSLAAYDMKAALEAARAARAKFPASGALSLAFAYALMQTGDTASALGEAHRYAELESARPVSFVVYGRILQSLGRLTEAEVQYRRSLTLAVPQAEAPYDGYEALAEVLELEGKTPSARQVGMDDAGQVDSTFKYADRLAARAATNQFTGPVSHFARGELHLKTGHCDKALEQFRQSDSIEVQAGIAECELQLRHRDVALRWRDRALANRQANLLHPGEIHARVRMTQLR